MTKLTKQAIADARHYQSWIKPSHFTNEGADHYTLPTANLVDVAAEVGGYGSMEQEEWDVYRDAFVSECERIFKLQYNPF